METAGGKEASALSSFYERCKPKLEQLEEVRLEKLRTLTFRKKIAWPLGGFLGLFCGSIDYWLLWLQRGSDDNFAGLTIVVLGGLWAWVTHPKRQYAKAYKKDVLPTIARLFGDFAYDENGKIPLEMMEPSKIVPHHTRYNSEDYFSGTYKNVGILFSEIHLKKKSGKKEKTVFKGLAVLLTQGTREFFGHTIMTKDQGAVGGWLKERLSGLRRADLVDPEFEKLFDVFTTDQVEARYLIDPQIIENLKALYQEYSGDKMMVAFYQDHVLILIESHTNHFEPASIDTPATNERSLLSMKREIGQILSIIDRLSLYDPRTRRPQEQEDNVLRAAR